MHFCYTSPTLYLGFFGSAVCKHTCLGILFCSKLSVFFLPSISLVSKSCLNGRQQQQGKLLRSYLTGSRGAAGSKPSPGYSRCRLCRPGTTQQCDMRRAAGPVTLKKAQQEESVQHASCVIGWWFAHLAEERRLFPFEDSASS